MRNDALRSLSGVIRLLRLRSTIGAPVLTLVGECVNHEQSAPFRLTWAAMSAFTCIAFAQVFNDILDRDLDSRSKPERPIPSGTVPLRTARFIAIGLPSLAIAAAFVAGTTTVALAVGSLTLGALYSLYLKSTVLIGNIVVSLVVSSTLLFGLSYLGRPSIQVAVGGAIIFFYILGNELFKTAADVAGDAAGLQRTISTAFGLVATGRAIAVCSAAIIAVFATAWLFGVTSSWFTLFGIALIGIPTVIGSCRIVLLSGQVAVRYDAGHRVWKAGWVPGIVVLLLLR
jgi:geranylgeranylglycerol-phosphate geranylgeranyltransferase